MNNKVQINGLPQRKSIRLKGYDYSQAGLYFITICTQNRKHLFGNIKNGKMILNNAGKMITKLWFDMINDFPKIKLHEFTIMPNHIHGIIQIVPADSISARTDSISARNADSIRAEMDSAPTGGHTDNRTDIPGIIQSFKRHTTIEYIKMVKQNILPPFNKRIWQRNYWEHIVRNENEYMRITQYIIDNPKKWENDKLNNGKGNIVMESPTEYGYEKWMI